MKIKLNHNFIPKQNEQHAWYLFNTMRQENKQTIIEYAIRPNEQAGSCEFRDNREIEFWNNSFNKLKSAKW